MIGGRLAARVLDAVVRNRAAVARAERRLEAHDAAPHAADDAEALYMRRRERRDLEDELEGAREALANSEKAAAASRVQQAEKEADAAHAAAQKLPAVGEKLTLQALDLQQRLAEVLAKLAENRAQVDAANKVRGSREFIVQGETRVRSTYGKSVSAIVSHDLVWVDADGNTVKDQVYDERKPGWIKNPAAVAQVKKEFIIRDASPAPLVTPDPFGMAIKLVDLAGKPLWPRA